MIRALRLSHCIWVLLLLMLLLVPVYMKGSYLLTVLTLTAIFAIAAVGYDVIVGYVGQLALSQAAFLGLGAYTSALTTMKLSFDGVLSLLSAVVVVTIVALMIGLLTLRLQGLYFAIATLAFNFLVVVLFEVFSPWTGGAGGLVGIPSLQLFGWTLDSVGTFYFAWLLLLLILAILSKLLAGRWGRRFRAVLMDEEGAESLGVPIFRTKVVAFVMSVIPAGLAGGIMAHFLHYASPSQFGLTALITLLLIVFLGGRGSLFGAVLGSLLMRFLPIALGPLEEYAMFLYGLIFVLVLRFMPDGLFGFLHPLYLRLLSFSPKTDDGQEKKRIPVESVRALSIPEINRDTAHVELRVEKVCKKFGGIVAIDQVSLHIAGQGIYGIIGPNGAGKSTLLSMIAGSLTPTSGKITFNGLEVSSGVPPHTLVRHGLIRTYQTPRLFKQMSVLENVYVGLENGRTLKGTKPHLEEAMQWLEAVGLTHVATQKAAVLTPGQQRLLELARVMATHPKLLLLDEPAAGLTDFEKKELFQLLKQLEAQGLCMIVVEHDMDFIMNLCQLIAVLQQGTLIASGAPHEIQRDRRVIEAYLGQSVG